jgi:Transposase DDE domain
LQKQRRFVGSSHVRRSYRQKDDKRHGYWAVVENYRTSRGPRQRVVACLGEMDAAGRLRLHQQAAGPAALAQRRLFEDVEPQWVEVDIKRIAVERKRTFGGPWLGLQLCRQVGLINFERTLATGKEEIPWPVIAQILILARLCNPSSELHIAEHFYESSALNDLLGVPTEKVNEDRLYRALDQLWPHKEALEKHLKNRLGELFELDYDLLLYDVTSTYFEGQTQLTPLAQRGYSRDRRPNCKQVNIALVVSREGVPLGYQLFAGNRNDVTTLEEIVERIERLYGQANRI